MTSPPANPSTGTDRVQRISDPRADAPTVVSAGNDSGTRATLGFGLNVAGFGSLVGSHWGDFHLDGLLGRGGMGAVFRGRQTSLDRPVAIKVLPPDFAEQAELRERFLREARAIAQVSSPHIVQVYHAGTHDGWYFYAMELVEGHDLGKRLRDGWRPTVAEARQLVLQAARGLAAAARFGIVHRDIKPANMLMGADGVLKITDFGLVRRAGEQELTAHGQVMGTAAYLSPEQATGRPCDARSDLYALGVVLFELLSGKPPFVGDTPAAVIFQHVETAPPPLAERCPGLDPATAAIAAKLLAKDPAERYLSAADLVRDLEAAVNGRSLRFAVPARRMGLRWPLVAAGAVAIAAALGWWWHARNAAEQARLEADRAAAAAQAEALRAAAAAREAARHDAHGRFALLIVGKASFRLRQLPAGSVRLGSPLDEEGRSRDETQATVRLTSPPWFADGEVTQGQWRALMGSPPEQAYPGDEHPVTGISRTEAETFCSRLAAQRPGVAARLPTEAEWEYAAHAGGTGPWSGGKALATQGWFAGNAGKRLHPVRQFPANPWGLYDLHGNAAEWTADAYADREERTLTDPKPVTQSGKAVVKGGAYDDDPEDCRIARRESAGGASRRIGFRFVCTALPAELR